MTQEVYKTYLIEKFMPNIIGLTNHPSVQSVLKMDVRTCPEFLVALIFWRLHFYLSFFCTLFNLVLLMFMFNVGSCFVAIFFS